MYVMSESDQAAVYLRLRKEYQSLKQEQAAIESETKHLGNSLLATGKLLNANPSQWNVDLETLCVQIRKAHAQTDRLRMLAAEVADKRAELEKFGEMFPLLS